MFNFTALGENVGFETIAVPGPNGAAGEKA